MTLGYFRYLKDILNLNTKSALKSVDEIIKKLKMKAQEKGVVLNLTSETSLEMGNFLI